LNTISLQAGVKTRPLTRDDFEQVVSIDARLSGRRRPGFYEKRLKAALAEPGYFIYTGCELGGQLKGFLFARLLEGEYGATERVAALDAIGVDPDAQDRGLGRALFQDFEGLLRHKQVREIQSQADWRHQSMLRFFSNAGFRLAPRHVLEREVCYVPTMDTDEEQASAAGGSGEVDFSDPRGDQVGALVRDAVFCRSLQQGDVPALIRIDRRVTGRERSAFYRRKAQEVLDETGIRSSLVAERDGGVVAFIMTRVDFGEFDRTEPVAVLDSMAVDPGFGHQRIGTALLAQLLDNLASLRLDRIRTEVDYRRFDLLSFLIKNGFVPSQQLAFSRRLAGGQGGQI